MAYCVEKGNLNFSHVLENDLLRKHLVITLKIKFENSSYKLWPVQKGVF